MKIAERVRTLPPYLFAAIERQIAERRAAGVDVISLGIGDPDLPTPPHVVAALAEAAADPATHQYPSNQGELGFREAVAGFYRTRFGVDARPGRPDRPAARAPRRASPTSARCCSTRATSPLPPTPGTRST